MRAEPIPAERIIGKYHFEKEAEDRIYRMSSALAFAGIGNEVSYTIKKEATESKFVSLLLLKR